MSCYVQNRVFSANQASLTFILQNDITFTEKVYDNWEMKGKNNV